jgi:CCR4-NOT transcription complex subunit 6
MSASFDKDKESLVKGFSPMHDHPLQHQLYFSNSAVNGSSNMVSSPSQSPASSSPSMVGYHIPMYGNNMARYPVQMNLAQKLQPQQQSGMNHNPLAHHALSAPTGNSPVSPHIDLSTLNSSQPNTPYLARQLSYAQMSRQSASPHHHARTAAALARGTPLSSTVTITDPNNPTKSLSGLGAKRGGKATESHEENGIPAKISNPNPLQSWSSLDMGGMGLQNLSPTLFNAYEFLTTLYVNHNNLTYLSSAIANLVNLKVLDASGNKLTSIPPEMGMLVQLKELLLFDNSLVTLPNELGTLYQLETLGLEGNPIHADLKSLLLKEGSQAVIVSLRENCPGMNFIYSCIVLDCHLVCHAGYLT